MLHPRVSLKAAGAALAGLFVFSGPVVAQDLQELDVETSVTISSDLAWRGISLTRQYPSAFGSITASSSGFYAGLLGVSFDGQGETSMAGAFYAGYGDDIGESGMSYTVEASYNFAAGDPRVDNNDSLSSENSDFYSAFAQIAYEQDAFGASAKITYDNYPNVFLDGNGSEYVGDTAVLKPLDTEKSGVGSKQVIYASANASYTVQEFAITADVGQFFDALDGLPNYLHYGVTASYDLGFGTTIGAQWYANNIREDVTKLNGKQVTALRDQLATGGGGSFLFFITTTLSSS